MRSSITSSGRGKAKPPASGTFVLRLDPALHAVLRKDAATAGASLNEWCGRLLGAPGGAGLGASTEIVMAIRARFGANLLGIVAYGSFTRGELAVGSDIDLLVVLEDEGKITRALDQPWEGGVSA